MQKNIVVKRSVRRKRTVEARMENQVLCIFIPATFSVEEEQLWVQKILERFAKRKHKFLLSDTELFVRAQKLSETFFSNTVKPVSVRWVENQKNRWGSATPAQGTIRLSTQLQGMPRWVVDYVLLHELAHFIVAGHGEKFWQLLETYPHTLRAKGFLEGYVYAKNCEDYVCEDPEPEPDSGSGSVFLS